MIRHNRLIQISIRKSGRCLKMDNRGSQIPIKSRKNYSFVGIYVHLPLGFVRIFVTLSHLFVRIIVVVPDAKKVRIAYPISLRAYQFCLFLATSRLSHTLFGYDGPLVWDTISPPDTPSSIFALDECAGTGNTRKPVASCFIGRLIGEQGLDII